jgi:hypothetical protein
LLAVAFSKGKSALLMPPVSCNNFILDEKECKQIPTFGMKAQQMHKYTQQRKDRKLVVTTN